MQLVKLIRILHWPTLEMENINVNILEVGGASTVSADCRGIQATTMEVEMRKFHIGTSPLTNRIYAGHVLKDGATWDEGKQDVTGAACYAVCEHVLANGKPVIVIRNGKLKYEITVREL